MKGACCAAHEGAGCGDAAIEACVCEADSRCCNSAWDEVCVALVGGLGCGTCGNDCCAPASTPGCAVPEVETCVCDKSAECCSGAWDEFCVLLVTSATAGGACGTCPGE
ncbi:MAG: hypothetical protein FJ104_05150 [Deltaproteobacteria bacterium]|nr:hypothetical protein [Deltaproteobacteria bacterium]